MCKKKGGGGFGRAQDSRYLSKGSGEPASPKKKLMMNRFRRKGKKNEGATGGERRKRGQNLSDLW